MGSVHLKRYVDRVQDVPGELRRHLALIRDLDEKVQHLQHEIETKSVKQVVDKKPKHSPTAPPSYDVASAVTKLVSLADEKVTIAAQVYDFIDKHIQSLDEDLRALDSEIRADKERLGLGEDESAAEKLEASRPQHKGRGRPPALPAATAAALEACPEKKRRGRKRANPEAEEEDASRLLPLQTEEDPLYCYCQKPSFGEMVACDNDECSLEWFHYDCVGLTAAPAGKWYCPDCIKIMQEKKIKEK